MYNILLLHPYSIINAYVLSWVLDLFILFVDTSVRLPSGFCFAQYLLEMSCDWSQCLIVVSCYHWSNTSVYPKQCQRLPKMWLNTRIEMSLILIQAIAAGCLWYSHSSAQILFWASCRCSNLIFPLNCRSLYLWFVVVNHTYEMFTIQSPST